MFFLAESFEKMISGKKSLSREKKLALPEN
jgi:hypothetical protein